MKKISKTILILITFVFLVGAFSVASQASNSHFSPEIKGDFIIGIPERKTFEDFAVVMSNKIIDIKNNSGDEIKDDQFIGTGFSIFLNGCKYKAVIFGDVDGNGVINVIDCQLIKRHYICTYEITGDEYLLAAGDDNLDGRIKAVKYLMVKRHVLGNYNINCKYNIPFLPPVDDESGWSDGWH